MKADELAKEMIEESPQDRVHVLAALDAFYEKNVCAEVELTDEEKWTFIESVTYLRDGYNLLIQNIKHWK